MKWYQFAEVEEIRTFITKTSIEGDTGTNIISCRKGPRVMRSRLPEAWFPQDQRAHHAFLDWVSQL